MLRLMRESAGSWIIKILLGLIVLAFIFVGTGTYNSGRASNIGSVNGKPITINDYQTAYYNILDNLRRQFGGQLNDEIIKMFNVQQQAIDKVIEAELMRQAAESAGIIVSAQELIDSITRIPAFQDRGVFDKERYRLLLSQNRLTPESFETMQKEAILFDKLRTIVAGSVKVSEEEARAWYEWENTAVAIDYMRFDPAAFTDIEVTDEMLTSYFDAHKQDYMTEPAVKARYVEFDPRDYRDRVIITDDEIENYYNANPDEFQIEETVSGRQIILKSPDAAENGPGEEKRAEALALIERVKAGEDFAELAKQYNEGPEKETGGAFGPLTRPDMLPAIAEAAFSMEIGDISDPIKTRHGWHILTLEERRPSETKSLADAAGVIRETLTERKARNATYDEAVTLYNITFGEDDLADNATDLGLDLVETEFFTRSQGPSGIPGAPEFAGIAFTLPLSDISDVIDINGVYYLVQVIAEQPAQIPDLETVRDRVEQDAMVQQRRQAAETAAVKMLADARTAGAMADVAKDSGSDVRTARIQNRNNPPPEFEKAPAVVEAAYNLSPDSPFPETIISGEDGQYYIISLIGRTLPIPAGFSAAGTNIIDRLTSQKQNDVFRSWMALLRENSRITISDQFRS